jgi:hypothetical protein
VEVSWLAKLWSFNRWWVHNTNIAPQFSQFTIKKISSSTRHHDHAPSIERTTANIAGVRPPVRRNGDKLDTNHVMLSNPTANDSRQTVTSSGSAFDAIWQYTMSRPS